MRIPKRAAILGVTGLAVVSLFAVALATYIGGAHAAPPPPQTISDSQLNPMTTTIGGATVLPTTRTVAHWWGSTTDPNNGVTYGYNMVGADPSTCADSACSVTITADIVPVNVVVGGQPFNGSDIVAATLASPVFATNDYGSTPHATGPDIIVDPTDSSKNTYVPRGPGGALSQNDAGNLLQLEDATMRAQFNQTGASQYHVILSPVVHDPVTIVVPGNKGVLARSGRGVLFADVNVEWWATQIQNMNSSLGYVDPMHLPIYLTKDVVNFVGTNPGNCCIIGFHGAGEVPGDNPGSNNGAGNQPVQTYAWASYTSPGFFARPNGGTNWALQDIHALSHEIAEWGDDPFINNTVEPWLTPTAPQYGCTSYLETGDPVVAIGFAMGTNTFDQVPNPWTSPTDHSPSVSYDGYYHPEDEVFLPWFLRTAPNNISEATQSPSANGGRYTLMGDLNPFPGFRAPATGC